MQGWIRGQEGTERPEKMVRTKVFYCIRVGSKNKDRKVGCLEFQFFEEKRS